MKPKDLRVYDAFPTLVDALVTMARDAGAMPLDVMRTVCDRIEAAGMYRTTQGHTVPMDPGSVAMARGLIEAAVVYRDAALAAVAKGVQP